MHYLEAVKATGSIDGPTVMKELKSKPINDFIIRNGHIQEDGSLVHDMYLYEVKKPSESKGLWDLYKLIATIPGADAYKRPRGNECPAVKS
jgi:branched-chain amino acid transport system substrate-binding protein